MNDEKDENKWIVNMVNEIGIDIQRYKQMKDDGEKKLKSFVEYSYDKKELTDGFIKGLLKIDDNNVYYSFEEFKKSDHYIERMFDFGFPCQLFGTTCFLEDGKKEFECAKIEDICERIEKVIKKPFSDICINYNERGCIDTKPYVIECASEQQDRFGNINAQTLALLTKEYGIKKFNELCRLMEMEKTKELIYNQFFRSPKFLSGGEKYEEIKEKLFVSAENPKSWVEQSDDEFFRTLKNLHEIMTNFHTYYNEKINVCIDYESFSELFAHFGNGLSEDNKKEKEYSIFNFCFDRLDALLCAGIDGISGCYGLKKKSKVKSPYGIVPMVNNEKVYFFTKSLHKYFDLIPMGCIFGPGEPDFFGGRTNELLFLCSYSPVLYGSHKYKNLLGIEMTAFDI